MDHHECHSEAKMSPFQCEGPSLQIKNNVLVVCNRAKDTFVVPLVTIVQHWWKLHSPQSSCMLLEKTIM